MTKKFLLGIVLFVTYGLAFSVSFATPKLTPEMRAELEKEAKDIEGWVSNKVFIDAVKKQNAEGLSLDEIKARDAQWRKDMSSKTESSLMTAQLNHPVGQWLKEKNRDSRGKYPEAFLTDNQGANIALSKLTSDYWQGDEDKWEKSYLGGKGVIFFGEPEFDQSSKSMLVQVSVPVMDGGKAIGVLIVGVKFSALR